MIHGGKPLFGEIDISGAKNAAVAIIPAALLVDGVCRIENVPQISDVTLILQILRELGADIKTVNRTTVDVDCSHIRNRQVPYELARKIRASYYLVGALLGRFGWAEVPLPGGCDLGGRPIDQHIKGFVSMGAEVDVRNGLTAADEDVAHMLRRSHKPIILAVNKCDNVGETPMELYEFYNLGFDEVMPISSVHGHGTGDLLDAVCAHLDFSETVVEEDRIPVAIIGRPNVGKSSLTNRILGENRMIVANEAGTTRDAIDTPVDNAYGKFIFTDTAGLRKRSNITDGLERYMVVRALAAVERSRVALILVDATVGFTEQDSKVAGYAHDQGKACIIVVNKWDAVEGKETNTMELQRRGYAECFSFMGYAPIIFISAQTGYNVNKLMQLIRDVDSQNGARVPTGVLNEMLARATARMQPPSDKGRRLKIFYLTQASTRPPTFVAFVNAKHLFHFSYQRYIINQIRENFGLEHTPIRLVVRERGSGEVGAKDV